MQLTLENKKLKEEAKAYIEKLKGAVDKVPGAIGYAFVVNGEFSSCDLYGNNKMFKKLWPRMLDACVNEAIADYDKKKATVKPDNKWMKSVFVDGHVAKLEKEKKVSPHVSSARKELKTHIFNGTKDLRSNAIIHRSFDAIDPNAPKSSNRLQNNQLNNLPIQQRGQLRGVQPQTPVQQVIPNPSSK